MEQVIKLLKESPTIYFGTADKNGRPHVRPFAFMLEREGKLYFTTSSKTSAFADLKSNPYTEISVMAPEYKWVRISAKVVFTDDKEIKEFLIGNNESVKGIYGTASNPDFNLFYLTEGVATLSDFSGNPPQTFTL